MMTRRLLTPACVILLAMLAITMLSSDSRLEAQGGPAGSGLAIPTEGGPAVGQFVTAKDLEKLLGGNARTRILLIRDPRVESNDPIPGNGVGLDFPALAHSDPLRNLIQYQTLDRKKVLDDLWSIVAQLDSDLEREDVDRKCQEKSRDLYDVYMAILKNRMDVLTQSAGNGH